MTSRQMERRIMELALEALSARRIAIEAEIQELTAALKGGIRGASGPATTRKRRSKTPAEKRAQSLRMKAYWAEKRAAKAKKQPPKRKAKTAAEKKALSLKMKQVWAKRKAEAAKKATSKG